LPSFKSKRTDFESLAEGANEIWLLKPLIPTKYWDNVERAVAPLSLVKATPPLAALVTQK